MQETNSGDQEPRRRFLAGIGIGVMSLGSAAGASLWSTRVAGRLAPGEVQRLSRGGPGLKSDLGAHQVLFNVRTTAPAIALTFDDGPTDAYTGDILDILASAGARATFNVVGELAGKRPDLLRRSHDEGHEIGNHSWHHDALIHMEPDEVHTSLERTAQVVESAIGVRPQWFRPPRGEITGPILVAAAETGHHTLMWSHAGRLQDPDAGLADHTDAFITKTAPGMISCYHDGLGSHEFRDESPYKAKLRTQRAAEIKALPRILEAATREGYEFVTVSELIELGNDDPRT